MRPSLAARRCRSWVVGAFALLLACGGGRERARVEPAALPLPGGGDGAAAARASGETADRADREAVADDPHAGAGAHALGDDTALSALVRARGLALCRDGPLVTIDDSRPLDCTALSARGVRAGAAPLEAVAADLEVEGQIWSVLAVEGAGERRVGTLASGWAPGVGGHSVEGETTLEARDLMRGGAPEIVATFSGVAGDSDMGRCDHVGREVALVVICSIDSGALACASFPTRALRTEDHAPCGDVDDVDGDGDRDERLWGEVAVHRRAGFELTLAFGDGTLTLTPSPGPRTAERAPVLGTVRVAALLARADLAWPTAVAPMELRAR